VRRFSSGNRNSLLRCTSGLNSGCPAPQVLSWRLSQWIWAGMCVLRGRLCAPVGGAKALLVGQLRDPSHQAANTAPSTMVPGELSSSACMPTVTMPVCLQAGHVDLTWRRHLQVITVLTGLVYNHPDLQTECKPCMQHLRCGQKLNVCVASNMRLHLFSMTVQHAIGCSDQSTPSRSHNHADLICPELSRPSSHI
jgi:hypothetical protein